MKRKQLNVALTWSALAWDTRSQDEYWEYSGDKSVEERGLTIGGYESAWLADLVAAYILENSTELFEISKYYGIYRDDGLNVLIG
jgi:hypothetical protein